MIEISDELEKLRLNLLDQTLRNGLLNYRPSKRRTIDIVNESPKELYNILVIQEKSMRFRATKSDDEDDSNETTKEENDTKPNIWHLNDQFEEESDHYFDDYLDTPYNSENLNKRLFYAYNQSRTIFEEQGYSVLYIALGFLEWKESKTSTTLIKAPLILVPVELTRTGKKRTFSLKWTGDDIYTNLTLQGRLESIDIHLPDFEMPEDKSGIDAYFAAVTDAIEGQSEWRMLAEVSVDFFNFRKFVMYKDLDPATWPEDQSPADHHLIQAIFDPKPPEPNDHAIDESEVDKKVNLFASYNILDADSSQIAAIEAVKAGQNLVVQGPPGTGKSQTIANIIAELLANGKSVLFVSEKMAALEVVKQRLDNAGLGDFCLELHSNKAKKTAVLAELRRSISMESPKKYNIDPEIRELEDLKRELNAYVTTLHSPIGSRGLTPFDLFSLKAKTKSHFQHHERLMQSIRFPDPESCTEDQWIRAISNLENFQNILPIISSIKNNPWKGCNPGIILPPEIEHIKNEINSSLENYDVLIQKLKNFFEYCGIKTPTSGLDIDSMRGAAQTIADAPTVTEEMLKSPEWDSNSSKSNNVIENLEAYQSLRQKISREFNDSIYDADLNGYIEKHHRLMKWAKLDFSSYYSPDYNVLPQDFDNIHFHLDLLFKQKKSRSTIVEFEGYGRNIFGKFWFGLNSNHQQLKDLKMVCLTFQDLSKKGVLPPKSVKFLENGISDNILKNRCHAIHSDEIADLFQHIEQYQRLKSVVSTTFDLAILNADVINLRKDYENQSRKMLKILSFKYWSLKKSIGRYYLNPPVDDAQILRDLDRVNELNQTQKSIDSKNDIGSAYFGPYWQGKDSNIEQLSEFSKLSRLITDELDRGRITETSLLLISEGIPADILTDASWHSLTKEIDSVISALAEYPELDKKVRSIFRGTFEEIDFESYLSEFNELLYDLKKLTTPYLRNVAISSVEETIGHFSDVVEAKKIEKNLEDCLDGPKLFGIHWKGVDSDPAFLREYSTWIAHFRHLFNSGAISESSIPKIAEGKICTNVLGKAQEIHLSSEKFLKSFADLSESVNVNIVDLFGEDLGSVHYDCLYSKLNIWSDSISILDKWGLYLDCRKKIAATVAEPLGSLIDEDKIEPLDIIPTFEGNFADALLRVAFEKNPLLANFVREIQEHKIEKFRELDKNVIKGNRKRLVARAFSYRPEISAGASRNSEVGILLGEFNRKRGIMPIRKLMLYAGRLIQEIKPCFMMSPLSIAQFLDPRSIVFDVVLFDEASQVRPGDALGAALRGKQLVVMGDSRQLPPTRFFDTMIDSQDEEEETALVGDMESILNVCRQSFMTKTLRWHYRSRHESLIAVSNQEFYDNQLYVYPSPMHETPDLGLKFVHLPEAVYDRGRSGVNRIEAQQVARMVVEHFKNHPTKTLGVGTFNVKQQDAILEEIEALVSQNHSIEQFFTNDAGEDFFVKNIETIQGDERDVIIVSVGFGFNGSGKLSKNFGPINQEGGERRLNVLMTRAREKCVVVANFTARDLQIDSNAPFGLCALKVFLEFAESGNLTTITRPLEDTDSPFEDAVYEFLRDSGYEVHKQVGCAGYRIDLAIVDPIHPGQYILGIECDGAQYHASKVARDRDRLRQDVLEGLGWTIHRVWSTDWYRHQSEAEKAIVEAVERGRIVSKRGDVSDKPNNSNLAPQENESRPGDGEKEQNVGDIVLPSLEDQVKEYKYCSSLGLLYSPDLKDVDDYKMVDAIITLVECEGPIHKEAVIQRIREECGVKRMGVRMREYVDDMINHAMWRKKISVKDAFLWPWGIKRCRSILRKRDNGESPNIDWICPEEIAEAIVFILEHQHSTQMEDLVTQTSHILGFKKTLKTTQRSIRSQINRMIKKEELYKLPNGMLNIKQI